MILDKDCHKDLASHRYQPKQILRLRTFNILHDHAQVPLSFKRAEHADHKGVLCKSQNVSLHKGLLDLIAQDEVLLINLLHGKTLAGLFMSHQIHSSKKEEGSRGQSARGIFRFGPKSLYSPATKRKCKILESVCHNRFVNYLYFHII